MQGSSKALPQRENVFLYVWGEHVRLKQSNELTSAIVHGICNLFIGENRKTIRLIADGCGGHNKNSIILTMVIYWMAIL